VPAAISRGDSYPVLVGGASSGMKKKWIPDKMSGSDGSPFFSLTSLF
jgi:hypothetical protein